MAPRPIGWIATRGADGRDNLAPYSFFNAVAYRPPQVMFASTGAKDSLRNIRAARAFSVSVVGFEQREAMNATSAALPAGEDEFARAGVAKAPCETIDCPRVAGAPATLECRLLRVVRLAGGAVGGQHAIELRDDCLAHGRFEAALYRPLARLGYQDYATVSETFAMERPA